jgi:hypothetical protein
MTNELRNIVVFGPERVHKEAPGLDILNLQIIPNTPLNTTLERNAFKYLAAYSDTFTIVKQELGGDPNYHKIKYVDLLQWLSMVSSWGAILSLPNFPMVPRKNVIRQLENIIQRNTNRFQSEDSPEISDILDQLLTLFTAAMSKAINDINGDISSNHVRWTAPVHTPCFNAKFLRARAEFLTQNPTLGREFFLSALVIPHEHLTQYITIVADRQGDNNTWYYPLITREFIDRSRNRSPEDFEAIKREVIAEYIEYKLESIPVDLHLNEDIAYTLICLNNAPVIDLIQSFFSQSRTMDRDQLYTELYNVYDWTLSPTHINIINGIKEVTNFQEFELKLRNEYSAYERDIFTRVLNGTLNVDDHFKSTADDIEKLANDTSASIMKLLTFEPSCRDSYPLGNGEFVSLHLFYVINLLLSDVDERVLSVLCVHLFSCAVVDVITDRVTELVWKSDEPPTFILDIKRKFVSGALKHCAIPYNIDTMTESFQKYVCEFVKRYNLEPSYTPFLTTLQFDRHARVKQLIKSLGENFAVDYQSLNKHEFCNNLILLVANAIAKIHSVYLHAPGDHKLVYDFSVLRAVFQSNGIGDCIIKNNPGLANIVNILPK